MSNSSLVTYTNLTKNKSKRNGTIKNIIPHCIVGQWTAKQGCDYFATTDRQCSANYVVGKDGSIGLSVDEAYRAWASGGSLKANGITGAQFDHMAVTIEVASDTTHPYAVTDAAYNALIELMADICKRNGIPKLLWKADKNLVGQTDKQNVGAHRWFANKSCPGDYLYERMGDICTKVNAKLGATADEPAPSEPEKPTSSDCPFAVNDTVEFKSDAKKYHPAGSGIPSWVKTGYTHIVTQTTSNGKAVYKGGERCVLLGKKVNKKTNKKEAGINTWVSVNVLQKVGGTDATTFKPYLVKVTASELNIRKGPGTGYAVTGSIKDKGIYTIVLEDASGEWGKLKSGAGWIALDYTQKR